MIGLNVQLNYLDFRESTSQAMYRIKSREN